MPSPDCGDAAPCRWPDGLRGDSHFPCALCHGQHALPHADGLARCTPDELVAAFGCLEWHAFVRLTGRVPDHGLRATRRTLEARQAALDIARPLLDEARFVRLLYRCRYDTLWCREGSVAVALPPYPDGVCVDVHRDAGTGAYELLIQDDAAGAWTFRLARSCCVAPLPPGTRVGVLVHGKHVEPLAPPPGLPVLVFHVHG